MFIMSVDLYKLCRSLLLQCKEFESQIYLHSIFAITELYDLQYDIPEGNSMAERVNKFIDFISYYQVNGVPAVIFFLRYLAEERSHNNDPLQKELQNAANLIENYYHEYKKISPRRTIIAANFTMIPDLYDACRSVLLRCDEFNSNAHIKSVFIVQDLFDIKNELPEGISIGDRVNKCITLLNSYQIKGLPAIVYFLKHLSNNYDQMDQLHHDIINIAFSIENYYTTQNISSQSNKNENQGLPDIKLRKEIRATLMNSFSDEDLRAFCFDYFPAAYENITTGMTKSMMTQVLLDYCYRHYLLPKLVDYIKIERPNAKL